MAQTFTDWELIVVCDGCEKSYEIVTKEFPNVTCLMIEKQPTWSGNVRNAGIQQANGKYILYIDNDDVWGADHLAIIDKNIGDSEWVFFNDHVLRNDWIERPCSLRLGHCGTSNICHSRANSPLWGGGYAHDYYFVMNLQRRCEPKYIPTSQYFVCHIPDDYDV